MYAVINKSGCEERKGNVKVRLDFFLEPDDPRYNDTYIPIIDPETEKPIGKYQLVPFHSHFIHLDPDFTEEDIKAEMDFHLPNFYKAFQDRWDEVNGGMRHGWATEKRIPPVDYSQNALRVSQCQDRVNELTELSYKPQKREGKEYPATVIDIGPGAIDRATDSNINDTHIDLANPANATGTIDTFEVWAAVTMTGTNKVGTFYGSGTSYTNRDGETIGTVTAGAKRTFSGLSIDVTTGDFAGIYHSIGQIERDASGGAGFYYKNGDQFGTGTQTYALVTTQVLSIYGTGSTAATYTKTVSMDALLRATDTEAINLDIYIRGADTETITLDALIKALGVSKAVALDVILRGAGIDINLDALLKGKADTSIDLDLLIQALDKQDISLDTLIVARNLESISVDALLKGAATSTVLLDVIIGEFFLGTASVSLDVILFKALPPNRIYTIEIRNGAGELLAILENAHGISYAQIINSPYPLTFDLPSDDSKASSILLANECWLRDNRTDTVIRKLKLQRKMDTRT